MKRMLALSLFVLFTTLGSLQAVSAEQQAHCAECGMRVDPESRFYALVEGENKTIIPFLRQFPRPA